MSEYRRRLILAVVWVALWAVYGAGLWLGAEEVTPSWLERYYNPQPAADDLVLPMPCGGAMVFRPIEVPSAGWLSDRPVELGHIDDQLGYKEGRRLSYIAGAFTDPNDRSRRYYYLAKYETTQDQYDTFENQCPKPSIKGQLPVVAVSWFDAVDFAHRYTEWLLQNARDQLPVEDEQPGFVRLPTEVEWEFAARGGIKVDHAEFLAAVFPMPEGDVNQYAWYAGPQSAAGRLHPVGLLKPNPVGLFDVLGNAAEMIFVPFHLDHRGRPHGQAGGFVSKGGDFLSTSANQVRTAVRDEHNYFDPATGQARRLRNLGFRLVLVAPVIASLQRLEQIQEEWQRLPDPGGAVGQQTDKALKTLSTATEAISDQALRAKLEVAQRDLERALTQLNEARDRAVKALIRMGAFLSLKLATDQVRLNFIERAIELTRPDLKSLHQRVQGNPEQEQILKEAEAELQRMGNNLRSVQDSLAGSLSYYGDMVIGTANDYSEEVLELQLGILKREFAAKQLEKFIFYAELFVNHIKGYQALREADTSKWFKEITKQDRGP